jgi:hypothetical protein
MMIENIPIDAGYWFDASGEARQEPRDPYLRWALLTNFRNLRRGGKLAARLSFIVECDGTTKDWKFLRDLEGVGVPPVYDSLLANGARARFATVRVSTLESTDPAETKTANAETLQRRLMSLLTAQGVKRVQLGYPRGNELEAVPGGPQQKPVPPRGRELAPAVLGIIDDGCPFAHPDLLDAWGVTRLVRLWQQTTFDEPDAAAADLWKPVPRLGYGRSLNREAMHALMNESKRGDEVDEALCYETAFGVSESANVDGRAREWFKPSRTLLTRASHGGSVLAVAAGQLPRLNGLGVPGLGAAPLHGSEGDTASTCPVIFVDLPREQVEISSGRWLPINGLDGLRYILDEARADFMRSATELVPVVVNLSSGSSAGAHVGEAMFERAMDELLAADDRLAITLAAGNSRVSEVHAQFDVAARGQQEVGVFIPPLHAFDSFIEFWLPPGVDLSDLSIQVQAPDGTALRVAGRQHQEVAGPPQGLPIAALMFFPHVVQATRRGMVLLAVGGSVSGSGREGVAAAGPWRVTVANKGAKTITVQAWIERDEVVFGRTQPQAARFLSFDDDEAATDALVRKTHTLSNIATGAHAFAVAAYRGDTVEGPMTDYSGAPADAQTPTYLPFAARAEAGLSHPGVRVAGQRGSATRRMSGTSVAAPQAARYLVNAMALNPSRAAVNASLPAEPRKLPVKEPSGMDAIDPRDGRLRL